MIFHKLVWHFIKHGDDEEFYRIQARDTVYWLGKWGVPFGPETAVLDLGCGQGNIGKELAQRGCRVTFADEECYLLTEFRDVDFRRFNIETEDLSGLGTYDLVICSNVLEHVSRGNEVISSFKKVLKPGGKLYLSWTNWLSPWGGHEYSPFHYLGARRGHLIYDKLIGKPRIYTPYDKLFPTSISSVLRLFENNNDLRVLRVVPRYYPELAFITQIPLLREFLTFNCLIMAEYVTSLSDIQ